jgi:hypothetical protein
LTIYLPEELHAFLLFSIRYSGSSVGSPLMPATSEKIILGIYFRAVPKRLPWISCWLAATMPRRRKRVMDNRKIGKTDIDRSRSGRTWLGQDRPPEGGSEVPPGKSGAAW